MFSYLKLLLTAALLGIGSLPHMAAAQTAADIVDRLETVWGNVQPHSVRYTIAHSDGSASNGTLTIRSPSNLTFESDAPPGYERGPRAVIAAQRVTVFDHKGGEDSVMPLGALKHVFQRHPNLPRAGSGQVTLAQTSDGRHYVVTIPGEQGFESATLFFQKSDYRLVRWRVDTGYGVETTSLHY